MSPPAHCVFLSAAMISSVKKAPAEQMVVAHALEFLALLSQPSGTLGYIELFSFYFICMETEVDIWAHYATGSLLTVSRHSSNQAQIK